MRNFKHWPLAIAVFAIMTCQVVCTRWSSEAIADAVWSSRNSSDYAEDFSRLRALVREVSENTRSIDRRLMTPGERLQDDVNSQALQKQIDKLMRDGERE